MGCNEATISGPSAPRNAVVPCEWRFSDASCQHLIVYPYNTNVLIGDTIRVWSESDDESRMATWSIEGDALAFVAGDTLASAVTFYTDRVLVTTLKLGESVIVARSKTREARTLLNVADSSVIKTLEVLGPDRPVGVGATWGLITILKDAAGKLYSTDPVWTSSDLSVVEVVTSSTGRPQARVRKAGNARLIASFLTLRDTLDITVVP
jgi:hypothetical protein